ncbi:Flp family type IVb pilin [Sphingomonas adhaesiva]|uniref:Flp family type IVb pilin n=1 Tax=Sphingomonas adhaesiva TaxID=28212 RepID=UPI002FFAC012
MLRPLRLVARLIRVAADSRGATAIEYGMILAVIALALVTAMNNWSAANNNLWDYVASYLVVAR